MIVRLASLLLLLLSFTVTSSSLASAQAPDPSSWNDPAEAFTIAGPIHFVGTTELAAYLITTPAGHILIDGGLEASGPLIERSIRTLGFKPEEIRVLLTTQAHFDHVASMAHFQRLSHARVEVMRGDDVLLESGGQKDNLAHLWGKTGQFPSVKVDRVLRDGDTVALGGVTLTARATPGHTRGCTTWLTTIADGGRSYAVVFTGSTTINPGTLLVGRESYPGIAKDYARSFALLESLKPDFFLAAHGSVFSMAAKRARMKRAATTTTTTTTTAGAGAGTGTGTTTATANPFVDPEGFRAHVAGKKREFEQILALQQNAAPAAR